MDTPLCGLEWTETLREQVYRRNAAETHPFSELIVANSELRADLASRDKENRDLMVQITTLRQAAANGSDTVSSDQIKVLQDKLIVLQTDLGARYKAEAATAQAQLALAQENRELRQQVQTLSSKVESQAEAVQAASAVSEQQQEKISALQNRVALLQQELSTTQGLLRDREGECNRLMAENEGLYQRILAEKAKTIDELNAMNDVVESARKRSLSNFSLDGESKSHTPTSRSGSRTPRAFAAPTSLEHHIEAAHPTEINCVKFLGSSRVVTGSSDGTCGVWDVSTAKQVATLRAESHPIMSVDVFDRFVLGSSNDKVARLWDVESERVRVKLAGHGGKIYSCCLFGNGKRGVTGGTDRQIKIWDLGKRNPCVRTIYCPSIVNSVHTTPEGNCIVSAHQDGGVRLWDTSTGRKVADTKAAGTGSWRGAATSVTQSTGDGNRYVLACLKEGTLRLLNARTLTPPSGMESVMGHDAFRVALSWTKATLSPGAFYASCGSASGSVLVWDVHTCKVERHLKAHSTTVASVSWSDDGVRLASCDKTGGLCVWK